MSSGHSQLDERLAREGQTGLRHRDVYLRRLLDEVTRRDAGAAERA